MASIEKRITKGKDGKEKVVWRGRYRDASGKERARHFPKRTEARDWANAQEAAVRRGVHVDPVAGRVKVREYGERWRLAQLHHRDGTATKVESVFRLHLYPHIGERRMSAVTRGEIQALVNLWAAAGLAPKTIETMFAFVSAMFHSAEDDGVIGKTPCTRIKRPEVVAEQVHPLTRAQVHLLIETVSPLVRPVVVTGAGLGVRVSEALGITVDRVRFLKREVMVDRQQGAKPPYPLVPLKNSRSTPYRLVPAPGFVLDALSACTANDAFDGRLFTRAAGSVLRAQVVDEHVATAVKTAGLPAGTTFHDLRHFYASTLIAGGESVVVVAARLGDTVTETLRTYAHLWPDDADRTRRIMDEAFDESTREHTASRGLTAVSAD